MTLTQTQLGTIGGLLDRRCEALLEEVRGELEASESQRYVALLGRAPGDSAGQSVADELAAVSVGVIDRHIREPREIGATRSRLRQGRFGICIDCGDEIASARLEADPAAKRCVRCQVQHERTRAHERRPTL